MSIFSYFVTIFLASGLEAACSTLLCPMPQPEAPVPTRTRRPGPSLSEGPEKDNAYPSSLMFRSRMMPPHLALSATK